MTSAVGKLHSCTVLAPAPNPTPYHTRSRLSTSHLRLPTPLLGLPTPRPTSLALRSNLTPSVSSRYTESVGSPSPFPPSTLQWNLAHRHILLLNIIASAVAVSATWLFVSAIPALLAFKRMAESLEKLMDVTREELPDTMATVRLSGMEISDLTLELSDLGQEITQGVRGSTRAIRLAEERLRQFTNMVPLASLQRVEYPRMTEAGGPALARSARGMKERIIKGRSLLQMFFTVTRFSRMMLNYFAKRTKK